jgi:hypothetical protein
VIRDQPFFNAFTYLSNFGESDSGVFHLETSKYIYERCDVEKVLFGLRYFEERKILPVWSIVPQPSTLPHVAYIYIYIYIYIERERERERQTDRRRQTEGREEVWILVTS